MSNDRMVAHFGCKQRLLKFTTFESRFVCVSNENSSKRVVQPITTKHMTVSNELFIQLDNIILPINRL